jgi:hypothetical protein
MMNNPTANISVACTKVTSWLWQQIDRARQKPHSLTKPTVIVREGTCFTCTEWITLTPNGNTVSINLHFSSLKLLYRFWLNLVFRLYIKNCLKYWILVRILGLNLSVCPSSHPFIYGCTVFLLGLGRFFIFLTLYTVGRTHWTGDQPVARTQLKHRTTQTQNKRSQITMPWVGFDPTIPAFELASSCLRSRSHCDQQNKI